MSTQISLLSWSHHFWSLEIMENLWTLDAAGVGMGSRARGENTRRLAWGRSWKGVGCHASFLPCESLPPGPLPLTERGAGATQGGRVDRQSPGLTPEPTGKTLQAQCPVSSLRLQGWDRGHTAPGRRLPPRWVGWTRTPGPGGESAQGQLRETEG